jgi:hypothetical protein
MRRLLRILINAATVLSLVLCVATVAAWVRSYRVRDDLSWTRENSRQMLNVVTYRGGLWAAVITARARDKLARPGARWLQIAPASYAELVTQATLFNRFGFALDDFQDTALAARGLACPFWFIMLLTAILPAARLAGWRRRRRQARRLGMGGGLCRHCGYDCRATPERCPECGIAPSKLGRGG